MTESIKHLINIELQIQGVDQQKLYYALGIVDENGWTKIVSKANNM